MKCNETRAQEGPPKLTDKRRRKKLTKITSSWHSDKLAKPPFFVAYSRLFRHVAIWLREVISSLLSRLSLLFGSCRLFQFTLAGPLNWSGKVDQKQGKRCYFYLFIHLLSIFYLSFCNPPGTMQNIDAQHRKTIDYAIIPTKYRLVRIDRREQLSLRWRKWRRRILLF